MLPADGLSTSSAGAARTFVKKLIRKGNERSLPAGYDVDTHFKPPLQPLGPAAVPGARRRPVQGDPRRASAEIVTDRIETFTENGIRLESGAELEADVIVTATGLNLLFLGGMELAVDGETVDFPRRWPTRA